MNGERRKFFNVQFYLYVFVSIIYISVQLCIYANENDLHFKFINASFLTNLNSYTGCKYD